MIYKARYTFEGSKRGMPYLTPGDVVELTNGQTVRIKRIFKHNNETVYDTDSMGIIFARELERI